MYPGVTAPALVFLTDVLDLQRQGNIAPFLAIFAFGFLVGVIGHLTASTEFVLAGIVIAGAAAVVPWFVWA
jgi:hypothetical protein